MQSVTIPREEARNINNGNQVRVDVPLDTTLFAGCRIWWDSGEYGGVAEIVFSKVVRRGQEKKMCLVLKKYSP